MSSDHYDLVVIGGGGAAREAARLAVAEHGARVAVVERQRWGGECGSVACKPTKQYVTAAELLADLRAVGAELGIRTGAVEFDLAALKERKDWFVGTPDSWKRRFDLPGLTPIDGHAGIVDRHTVRVGDRVLAADRILIATGSRTAVPPIEGIEGVSWIDNVQALELTEVPESLLVVGAGAVGLEFGQVFARFGSRVTIVEALDQIAGRADAEAAASLEQALVAEGIDIRTGTIVKAVEQREDAIVATLVPRDGGRPETVVMQKLMLASGRRPNVEGLGLEEVGVDTLRQGIVTDAYQRTSVPGVWAAGDVVAGIQLTPIAAYQGQVAVTDMFGGSARMSDYSIVPAAIFTDPEIAGVGLTEHEAREKGFDTGTSVVPAAQLIRPAYTQPRGSDAPGLVKLVYENGSRRVLGLHAVIRGGAEFVQGFAVAIRLGATVEDVALGHYAFPTSAEAVHYAAEAALAGALVGA
jgi:pyruvate/2-oxoglutarate dehydrogenase complex dihydrolipoamide dehydrogenase (E3) component